MFFQVSPPAKKVQKKTSEAIEDVEHPSYLSLAPFTPVPKILFDNVIVGKRVVHPLVIQNPYNHSTELNARLDFPEDIGVELSWIKHVLDKNSEVLLEIAWTPVTVGSWRYVFHLSDGCRIQRDIPIVFKSIAIKKSKVNSIKSKTKGLPTFVSKKVKSPLHKATRKKSPLKRVILPNITNMPQVSLLCSNDGLYKNNLGKENYFTHEATYVKVPQDRRNTYVVSHQQNRLYPTCADSLEMKSPVIPPTLRDIPIDKRLLATSFMFTPDSKPTNNLLDFNPEICSTNEKSMNNTTVHGIQLCLFTEKDFTFEVPNIQVNLSASTFVHGDNSMETSAKCSFSGETYVKDTSVGDLAELSLSPINHVLNGVTSTVGTNELFYKIHRPLHSIIEESSSNISGSALKRKSHQTLEVTPRKRPNLSPSGLSDWSVQGGRAFRTSRKSSGLNIIDRQVINRDTSQFLVQNPFLFAAVDNVSPFMTSVYLDESWIDGQEKNFKKWLNALLTPPAELHSNEEGAPVDVAKLWRECKNREVAAAPSREIVSIQYHTNSRLRALRKSALNLFRSEEFTEVLMKVETAVDTNRMSVRQDKSLHLDLTLQSEIMSIILSYNPLWLRIGLETIYNKILPMNSNSDLMGLTSFLFERFFKDPYLLRKYKTMHCSKYSEAIKKFILKKFLILVYFLDQAKTKKIIAHDPCLFRKSAPIKESREALLKFTRECLSGIGDITRYLKCFHYTVHHKQTYIDEFDYAVKCLGVDLRDGVRLTRVMEIILLKNDLTMGLRVPAISKLQKIHNMKIVFDSLQEAGFEMLYDISPKDIVIGHKEKTLSFLWQLIYKFQAPLIVKSVTSIQHWWRSDKIMVRRQQLNAMRVKKCVAATTIQVWYRRQKFASKIALFSKVAKEYIQRLRQDRAATEIQKYVKMYLTRKKFLALRKSVTLVQTYSRRWLVNHYHKKRILAVVVLQSYIRMLIVRRKFEVLKYSVLVIEQRYVANKLMRSERERFERLKKNVVCLQQILRANRLSKKVREEYELLKSSTIVIQRRFRAKKLRDMERNKHQTLRHSAVVIQRWYRCCAQRNTFNQLKAAAITIQRLYKRKLVMRLAMYQFQVLKEVVINIQTRYRANVLAKIQRKEYQALKRAVVLVQRHYRAKLLVRKEFNNYQSLKNAAILVQRRFRAKVIANVQKHEFKMLKHSVILIQARYRGKLLTRKHMKDFEVLKETVINIQRRYRAKSIMKIERNNYCKLQEAALLLQRRYRAMRLMQEQVKMFASIKKSAVVLQRHYRARLSMKSLSLRFETLRTCAITIQRRYRAKLSMRAAVESFQSLKSATIVCQRRYRATMAMKLEMQRYKLLQQATVNVQRRYRANLLARLESNKFNGLKKAVLLIQTRYAAKLRMKEEKQKFETLKQAVLIVQARFRANRATRMEMQRFDRMRRAAVLIQTRYRSILIMREERREYQVLKIATITIQRHYRGRLAMKMELKRFEKLKRAVVTVQRRYRAKLFMQRDNEAFKRLKYAVISIQRRYRANIAMKVETHKFEILRKATLTVQRWYRSKVIARSERNEFENLKQAAIIIQRRYRAMLLTKQEVKLFARKKHAVLILQKHFRKFLWEQKKKLRISAIVMIQKYARAFLVRKQCAPLLTTESIAERRLLRQQYAAAVQIQAAWRGYKSRSIEKPELQEIRNRCKEANANAVPQKTLGSRCNDALKLLRSDSVLEIISALGDLDFITRRCKKSCKKLGSLLPTYLYTAIVSTNRSPAEMIACTTATKILINFYRYEPTRLNCWIPEHTEMLITVMLHCCDKEDPLFPTLCTLVWLYSHTEEYKNIIRETPNFAPKLKRIEMLVIRKEKMVSKVNVKYESLFGSRHPLYVPSLKPDWGLDYPKKPRTFSNSVHAYKCLKSIMDC